MDLETRVISSDELELLDDLPDYVFHALGNAEEIQHLVDFHSKYPKVRLINLHDPVSHPEIFDMIFQSSHIPRLPYPNVLNVEGVPSLLSAGVLNSEMWAWRDTFSSLTGEIVGVLIGGSTKDAIFSEHHGRLLGQHLEMLRTRSPNLSFVVINSRRTSENAMRGFRAHFKPGPNDRIFDWKAPLPQGNPYTAILGNARYIIVTGDSVSMISDALTVGKPTYIFAPDGSLEERHKSFILQQAQRGRVRPLGFRLEAYSYSQLNAAKNVAREIRAHEIAHCDLLLR